MSFTPRFAQALAYAAQLHARQTRKGTQVPYVAHLLAVAAIAIEHGATEDEAIAALLHDAIEDQGGAAARDAIRHYFGQAVVEIVDGCTDAEFLPKPPWRERKEAHLAQLKAASSSVLLVCAADKLHNSRAIIQDFRAHGETLWARFSGGREGTLWYYRQFAALVSVSRPGALAEELNRTVDELEQLVGAH